MVAMERCGWGDAGRGILRGEETLVDERLVEVMGDF